MAKTAADRHFEANVIRPHIAGLRRYARRLASSEAEAEDLVQEAVLRAWKARATFRDDAPGAWLYRILYNHFVNIVRRQRAEAKILSSPDFVPSEVHQPPCDHGLKKTLRSELEAAPPEFREIIELVLAEGRTYVEASEALGIPVGTVMSRVFRARRDLRVRLLRAGVEAPGL